jgi:hypothetical protein
MVVEIPMILKVVDVFFYILRIKLLNPYTAIL